MVEYEAVMDGSWKESGEKRNEYEKKYRKRKNVIAQGNLVCSIESAANYLGINPRTVLRNIKSGKFPLPVAEFLIGEGGKTKRIWTESCLLEYKNRGKGRPSQKTRDFYEKMKKVIPLYKEGKSIKQISTKLEIDEEIVSNFISKFKENDGEEKRKNVIREFNDGIPQIEIAKKYNYSTPAVNRIIRNYNVENAYNQGMEKEEIAEKFGICTNTVNNILFKLS